MGLAMKTRITPLRLLGSVLAVLVLTAQGAVIGVAAERSDEAGQYATSVLDKEAAEGLALKLWLHRPEMAPPASSTPSLLCDAR